jgi:hypothetical protein
MKRVVHPVLRLSRAKQIVLFLASTVLTFVLFSVLRTLDSQLNTAAAPWGMLSFEFAHTPDRSEEIIKSWNLPAQKSSAESSVLLGFLFPPCYSTMMTIACFWAAGMFHDRGFHKTGWLSTAAAWLQWPAAVFDWIENFALWVQLKWSGSSGSSWPQIAFVCATIKFALVLAGVSVLIAAVVVWIRRRRITVPASSPPPLQSGERPA